jgi:hypothetical protein
MHNGLGSRRFLVAIGGIIARLEILAVIDTSGKVQLMREVSVS